MSIPKLRVTRPDGVYDLLATDGTMDFDGGSLIVWRDKDRKHLIASYSPIGWLTTDWEEGESEQVEV